MADRSEKREEEVEFRENVTVKKILTVENDRVDNLPPEERLKLMKEIEEMGDWRGLYEEMYVAFLEDPAPEIRRLAASAFWDFPEEKHIDTLIQGALEDPDESVRAACCSSLGRHIYEGFVTEDLALEDYEDVKEALLGIARDPEQPESVRSRALESLSFDTDDEIVDLIDEAYRNEALQWKSCALFAMGRSHLERFHRTIISEMSSASRRLQIQALCAAREAYLSDATPRLCELAQGADKEIRLLAIAALPFTRGEGAVEALEACSMGGDMDLVEAAEKALDDYFGLEEEQLSETDLVDVRLGTTSDIPILDSSKIEEQLMRSVAAEQEKRDKKKAEEDEEGEEDEEEEAEPAAVIPEVVAGEDDLDEDEEEPT